ncbi:MAG: HisS family protein [Nanoarchaeota archaeon]
MNTETVRGFQDFTGEEAEKREKIREILVKNFELYGFEPAETPIIEQEEFVKGDNEYDEAVSDIFKLKDKGQRNLALRYELTFPLKRIAQNKKLPYKRYQIGPVFRDEPVSGNRFRQFIQCDADTIGSSVKEEAEILALTSRIMKELKISAEIQVNSRKLMNSAIKSLGIENAEFVLRELDKVEKQGVDQVKSEMAKFIEKDKIVKLFRLLENKITFFKKFEGYKELKEVIDLCKVYKINVTFKPTLARGLSYYNGTVFEVKTKEIKENICGGGSYIINKIQSVGISFGLERLSQLAKIKIENKNILIININQDGKSLSLAEKLRNLGNKVIVYDKVSKGLEFANSLQIPKVIFIGSDEVKKKKFKLRDMKTGKEEMLGEKELINSLAS